MFEVGQMVVVYKSGVKHERTIARVIPQKPILDQYIEHAAVLFFTDKEWAFSWNCYPTGRIDDRVSEQVPVAGPARYSECLCCESLGLSVCRRQDRPIQ